MEYMKGVYIMDETTETKEGVETKEETKETKEQKEEKTYTDEEVDAIIDSKFARWKEQQEKEIDEAKKLADMDAQQKAEYETQKLKEELEELKAAATKAKMSDTARTMLSERGITVGNDLIKTLVSTDADETQANVEAFSKAFNEAVNKAVLDKVKGNKHNAGSTSSITKEEILKIQDTRLRQEKIKENLHLFE